MIAKKLDLFENGLAMTDAKTKMLNLKVRAQPNQRKCLIKSKRIGSLSTDKEELSELEKLRLEMVEELRKVREDLRQSSSQTTELVTEMKQMN
jgi:hypothetical protein